MFFFKDSTTTGKKREREPEKEPTSEDEKETKKKHIEEPEGMKDEEMLEDELQTTTEKKIHVKFTSEENGEECFGKQIDPVDVPLGNLKKLLFGDIMGKNK